MNYSTNDLDKRPCILGRNTLSPSGKSILLADSCCRLSYLVIWLSAALSPFVLAVLICLFDTVSAIAERGTGKRALLISNEALEENWFLWLS